MRYKTICILFSIISACSILSCTWPVQTNFEPVAVIELFTSEGCSSCPAADKLLGEEVNLNLHSGKKIFALAFHVDYWNRLGWKDSFSSKQFSDRQGMYADALKLNGVYTPQMIVNGRTEFVGSDKVKLDASISDAMQRKSSVEFENLNAVSSGKQILVAYALRGDLTYKQINFALVSEHEATAVKRGENSGRKLEHTNVVRQFVSVKASPSGNISLENNTLRRSSDLMLIAYVQQSNEMTIVGAATVKVQ